MGKIIDAYLWGYKNYEAADVSFRKFKEFYPNSNIFIRVDIDGDYENYEKVANKYNANISKTPIKIGYPGNFNEKNIGRDGWPKENTFEWLNGIYLACKKSTSKYMIILEEDVFILKPITILNGEFGAAIVRTNNTMPYPVMNFIKSLFGNTSYNKYGCCGGCIINVEDFIRGWEYTKDELWQQYDILLNQTKLIGWSDCVLQIIIQCSGSSIVINEQLVEPWMQSEGWISDDWRNYEIINYLKDIEIIKSL
jgi:hypothetical protein